MVACDIGDGLRTAIDRGEGVEAMMKCREGAVCAMLEIYNYGM